MSQVWRAELRSTEATGEKEETERGTGTSWFPFFPVPALLLHTCPRASVSAWIQDLGTMSSYSTFGQAPTHQTGKMPPAALSTGQELFLQESSGVIPASSSHCSPTHLRASIDEEHCGVLLPRLQVVGFVHHSIQGEPRGALEGEHFRGNVIRKRTCHGREERAWFKQEWMSNTALLHHCPITSLTAIPVRLSHAFQWMWLDPGTDWECPSSGWAFWALSHSHPCSPVNNSNFSPLTQPLLMFHSFLHSL